MRQYVRLILFLSSYAPLLVIFAMQNRFNNYWVSVSLIGIGFISVCFLAYLIRFSKKNIEPIHISVQEVNYKDGEAVSYIVTYIIPFIGIDLTSLNNWASLLIMFVILAVLYINSNLLYINPLLNIAGFHIYEVKNVEGATLALISKDSEVRVNEILRAVNLHRNVYLEVKQNEGEN
ncbi:hypothetical protein ACPUYX_19665 [Desulfosporosinus sp. SYSU MS00001]|uniref:hypothetical protein n=1 Tax=Desulfosporosinus sp. SYSU MS00001 TaxID=3416284 RepID=UPI003CED4855